MKSIGRPFLILLLILILTVAGFVYYYLQAAAAIATANTTAFTLSEQVSRLQSQVSLANSQIASVQGQLASTSSLLSAMQGQLAAANTQASSLQKDIAAYQSQVASLQGNVSSYKSQVSSLQGDITLYQSQVSSLRDQLAASSAANISALQAQVAALQGQNHELTDIANLAKVVTKADRAEINQLPGHQYTIVTFTADYAGYITISGQTTSTDIYFTVTDSFPGYPHNDTRYPFVSNATLVVPVLPGTITVYYNNANPNAPSTGIMGVKYYY